MSYARRIVGVIPHCSMLYERTRNVSFKSARKFDISCMTSISPRRLSKILSTPLTTTLDVGHDAGRRNGEDPRAARQARNVASCK